MRCQALGVGAVRPTSTMSESRLTSLCCINQVHLTAVFGIEIRVRSGKRCLKPEVIAKMKEEHAIAVADAVPFGFSVADSQYIL